jgi:hypothetical protein
MMAMYPELTRQEIRQCIESGRRSHAELVPTLDAKPRLVESSVPVLPPQEGEKMHIWLVSEGNAHSITSSSSSSWEPRWKRVPEYLVPLVEHQLNNYSFNINKLREEQAERNCQLYPPFFWGELQVCVYMYKCVCFFYMYIYSHIHVCICKLVNFPFGQVF